MPGRSKSRQDLLRMAQKETQRITGKSSVSISSDNIISTGHQAVWRHCGILAKDIAMCKLSQTTGGYNLHLVLDHDICDTAINLPKQDTLSVWTVNKLEIESKQQAVPLEFRPLPHKSHIQSFITSIVQMCSNQFCNTIWHTICKSEIVERLENIADLITYLQSILSDALGLSNIMYLPVSKLSQSDVFLDFVITLMLDAKTLTCEYNNGVKARIRGNSIHSRASLRPLEIDNDEDLMELPFWLVSMDGQRSSLWIRQRKHDNILIGTATVELGIIDSSCTCSKRDQLKKLLRLKNYRLRPKAVSLTLFIRLFLSDWFVHGVGGTNYAPITDHLIKKIYKIKPPEYGVATCTVTMSAADRDIHIDSNVSRLRHKLHHAKYNPEAYMDESTRQQESIASIINKKKELIAVANNRSSLPSDRKAAWHSILKINKELSIHVKESNNNLKKKIAEIQRLQQSQKVYRNREYFFGLFPEEILKKLIETANFKNTSPKE